jgi:outer membrane protein OmpA-like peptidoglycan-associated protein
MWEGASSRAAAQTNSGASNDVIVNYDVLNALPGQSYGAPAAQGTPAPQPQYPGQVQAPPLYGAPAAVPPYYYPYPYGALPPGLAATLPVPPPGAPMSVLTTIGPDGRPVAPIRLMQPGSGAQNADSDPEAQGTDSQIAAVTPPDEPVEVPDDVPMPEPTPPAPAPGVNAGMPPAVPEVGTPERPAETPAAEAPAEQAAEEQAAAQEPAAGEAAADESAQQQAAQEQPAETPAAETPPPAEGETATTETEEQPEETAAAEPAPEPDNSQTAPPVPEGGIRIVFPTELNDVPVEANAALDDLAAQMVADESMRIQIKCYASGDEETESKARRRSLARCINIRQYLFKKDVRTTRMDVRALGLKSEGQPADRVDIVPANS